MKPKFTAHGDSFVIENYNHAMPFSDFFPALAGVTGKPMWVFTSNRGQGISSFGINNKDGAMLEFLPANKAYQVTPSLGFRTFIKTTRDNQVYEPFVFAMDARHQTMRIRPYELEINDRSPSTGLESHVVFYGVPGETCAVLARSLTLTNTSTKPMPLTIVDGLPRVKPWGMNDYLVKNMSRTIEAFAEVLNLKSGVPFFKLKIEPADRPDIHTLAAGFFAFSVMDGDFSPMIVDPAHVFGTDTSFSTPAAFIEKSRVVPASQLTSNIMPSAFSVNEATLRPKESITITSYYGYAESLDEASAFGNKVKEHPDYFTRKRSEMKQVYEDLVTHFGFSSGVEELNQYANATFMDNVLRGGLPVTLNPGGPPLHVFSRKHGDMERDYNAFQISASYYSQGNGNFRDVSQNRRNDLFINAHVGTANLDMFFNLLQLDGYNPLVINPDKYLIPRDFLSRFELKMSDACKLDFHKLSKEPVLAGQIYDFLKKYAEDPLSVGNNFKEAMAASIAQPHISHGEGYWIDHWTYSLDHLDQYFSVYPDKKVSLLFEKKDYTFYDSDHVVRPRREKYVLTKDGKLRQYEAVTAHQEKKALIESRASHIHKVRVDNGQGEVFKTTLFVKLLSLAAIKVATLDPYGVGIEMEADKPGWCDAMNGAPGLFGSSTHEMFELTRLVSFLLTEALPLSPNRTLDLPQELYGLIRRVNVALENASPKDFRPAWNELASAREEFREKTLFGLSGKPRNVKLNDLKKFLESALQTLHSAAKKAIDNKTGLPISYFTYEVDAAKLDDGWRQFMVKLPWKQHAVAPFLEGAVHAMKVVPSGRARQIYSAVRRSDLYDEKLGMYRLNAPLDDESMELGRAKVFCPGWLENESIFLHMHYKFLLEILRSGMTDVFFKEMSSGLIPFRDPVTYGRPTFENSSFIASSAFPDPSIHGKGFVARLSGATSEFMSMIYFMAFGRTMFRSAAGQIVFSPEPSLPKDWFTKNTDNSGHLKNSFSLKLFGVPVTYVNDSRKNTTGPGSAKPVRYEWIMDGRFYEHKGRVLTPEASLALREAHLESLTIFLA